MSRRLSRLVARWVGSRVGSGEDTYAVRSGAASRAGAGPPAPLDQRSRASLRRPPMRGLCATGHSPASFLVRCPRMALQASSASVSVSKGEPPTLMAQLL
jgi:hypothetical protein